jgi:hypothetical protein
MDSDPVLSIYICRGIKLQFDGGYYPDTGGARLIFQEYSLQEHGLFCRLNIREKTLARGILADLSVKVPDRGGGVHDFGFCCFGYHLHHFNPGACQIILSLPKSRLTSGIVGLAMLQDISFTGSRFKPFLLKFKLWKKHRTFLLRKA